MKNSLTPSLSLNAQLKDTKIPEIVRTLLALSIKGHPQTMKMVAEATNIDRANLCRYFSIYKRCGKIAFVKKGLCHISNHKAGFYSITEKGGMELCK